MAKEKIAGTLATNIGVNTANAVTGIDSLKNSVKDSTNAWKQMEAQMKLSGDTLGASKAEYEGLSDSLSKQKSVLERLKQEQSEVNRSTSDGEKAYQKYASQITQAEVKLAALNGQQDKARQAYEYQKSGLAKLNEEVQHSNKLTEERVKQLEAEGKTEEANKAKIDGLKSAQEKYSQILKIQKTELEKLGESGDKNSKAYRLQEVRVAQMSTKVSEATRDIKLLNGTEIKPRTEGLDNVKSKISSLDELVGKTNHHFRNIFMADFLSQSLFSAIDRAKYGIGNLIEQGTEYNKEMQVMDATWTTLTGDPTKSKEMVDGINEISTAFGQTNDLTNELEQQFYHVFNQKEPTEQLTKSVLAMADTIGLSAADTERLGLNFTHMMTSTKLQLGDFNMITDQLPMYGEKLLEFERNAQKNQSLTMAQLREQMSAGKISAKDAEDVMNELGVKYKSASENMMSTTSGMERVISARGKALAGALLKPIANAKNPIFGAVSKWVSDKKTEDEFTKVGTSISKAFSTITDAFSKEFKGQNFTDVADKMMASLSKNIEKIGTVIAAHSKDIIAFFKTSKELGSAGFQLMGDALKTAVPWIKKFGAWASKHPKDVKKLAVALLGLNVALKGTLGVLKGVEKFKEAKKLVLGFGSSIKKTATGMKLAFNFLKTNPFILIITGIVAVVAAFVELYKHNKKFREFINGIAKAVSKWAGSVVKWFKKTWNGVSKGFNNFVNSFSKVFNSLLNGIKNAWNSAWSWIGNVFNKYIDVFKSVLKLFTDFFTGKWGNLGKDIQKIWNALWGFVESIFGKKVDSIKKGIEGFGAKIWDTFNTIKTKVSDFWKGMWNGLVQFGKDGINSVIGVINNGIGGINGVIHTFGGPKHAIGNIPRLANGTKGAPKGVALINDAPGEHYQEAVIDNSGQIHVLEGRNRLVNFQGGETVVPAHAIPHFENGTPDWLSSIGSWVKDKWDGLTEMIKHPIKTLTHFMTNAISGISGSPLVTSIAPPLGNGFVNAIVDPIKKLLGSLKKKHEDDGGGSQGSPSGSGVQRWAGQVKEALAANGLSTSQDMIDRVLRQIASESSGNEKAVQGNIGDINNITGDLAKGLMQTISSTFNANKFPGHGDIFNGYDNLLAALNYAKKTYGPSLSFLGNGHGYENGGLISSHGLYEIGEGNKPEMVIPLSVEKNARANQLLAEANQRINGNNYEKNSNRNMELALNQAVNLLSQVLGATKEQTIALKNQPAPIIDENSFFKGAAPTIKKTQDSYQNRKNRLGGIMI